MKDRIMIDASIILHQDSLFDLTRILRDYYEDKIVISKKLIEMLKSVFIDNDQSNINMLNQLAIQFEIKENISNPELIKNFLIQNSDNIKLYESSEINNEDLYGNLLKLTESRDITQILYEEWEFLTTNSWLIAKFRAAFDKIVEAGGVAVQVSQKAFDKAVRKTLKKPEGDISPNDKILATGKWIAVGGSAIADLLIPVAGAIVTVASGIFLLCDP
ncbi:hypothetical protein [Christiangramia sp.]|uniref:hypothetical protein n=1 Tax=Christiangramia sp. TaxID=1931228 RepID=UPI0026077ECC|nr:hypothetical protein [Christiangramia sp.]